MSISRKITEGAGSGSGSGGGSGGYVDDVFSTYLYEGDQSNSTRSIFNGIDLDGEGGMVWIKMRSKSKPHYLFDTERGAGKSLSSDATSAESAFSNGGLQSFNSDGFDLGDSHIVNETGEDFASWTFRKQPKFFDVVTWTGDGSTPFTLPHNLGTSVGMSIVKSTSDPANWLVNHVDLPDHYLHLNQSGQKESDVKMVSTDSTVTFTGSTSWYNRAGREYVAYLFAHDDSDEGMIQCGSYTGNGVDANSTNEINLGWEPQWVMVKNASGSGGWYMQDTMRGLGNGLSTHYWLQANESADEKGPGQNMYVTPTGFLMRQDSGGFNANGQEYIYMAIRRPNKPAEEFEADELFAVAQGNTKEPGFNSGFPVDMAWYRAVQNSGQNLIGSRLTQGEALRTNESAAASSNSNMKFDYQDGWFPSVGDPNMHSWMWRRAPGFFDVVTYKGDGQAGREVPHNLGVEPDMMWVKDMTLGSTSWMVYLRSSGFRSWWFLDTKQPGQSGSNGPWGGNATEDSFTVSSIRDVNVSDYDYIACLWASVPGVCSIGTYTGNGGEQDIDCGFTNGARFVLTKRTDGEGNWMYFDTVRGINATGNSPHIALNDYYAQIDYYTRLNSLNAGFKVVGLSNPPEQNTNASGAEYIYMAIA